MVTRSPEGRAQVLLERKTEPSLEPGDGADRRSKRGFSASREGQWGLGDGEKTTGQRCVTPPPPPA